MTPRKLAHQILTIREDVSGELIADLACIKLENQEVERFAADWMARGYEKADGDRRLTRHHEHEGSTPLRNKNYNEISVYITNFALDLIKMQLAKKSVVGLQFLNSMIDKFDVTLAELDPLEQLVRIPKGPTVLLEELYYHGVSSGVVVTDSGENLNSLKIAQDIMALRLALATEASRILADLATNSRQYYKMIKVKAIFACNKIYLTQLRTTVGLRDSVGQVARSSSWLISARCSHRSQRHLLLRKARRLMSQLMSRRRCC